MGCGGRRRGGHGKAGHRLGACPRARRRQSRRRAVATRHSERVKSLILLAAGGRHAIREKLELFANETMFVEPTRETFIRVMHDSGFFAASADPLVWIGGWWRATARPQAEANRA